MAHTKQPVILHLANDEKFINTAYELFEAAFPGCNRFIIIKPPANPPLRYVESKPGISSVVMGRDAIDTMKADATKADAVVLHGIDIEKGAVLLSSADKSKFAGIIFGAELYNVRISGIDFLYKKTRHLKHLSEKKKLIDYVKKVYRLLAYRGSNEQFQNVELLRVFANLSWFGTHSPESLQKWIDLDIIGKDAESFHFSYFPIERIVSDPELRVRGNSILLGNSAAPTNNHIEALDLLKKEGIGNRTIISPLSYGNRRYADMINDAGRQMFGNKFEIVDSFLSLPQYAEMISRCEIVIMNHLRSQAFGTTLAAIYLGAKVFLNNTEAYRYLTSIGCEVFLIEESLLLHLRESASFENEAVEKNRKILRSKFSQDVLANSIKKSFTSRYSF